MLISQLTPALGLPNPELDKIRRRPPPVRECAYTSADLSLSLLFSLSLSLVYFQQKALEFLSYALSIHYSPTLIILHPRI